MPDPDPELAHSEAAWVLGTLDPDDAEWFAGHLPSCPDCRAAVAEFGQARYAVGSNPCRARAPRSARLAWNARVFTVPSGSSSRAAIWDWVGPSALKATVGKDGLFDLSRALAWLRDNASDVHVEIGIDEVAGDEGFDRVKLRNGVFEPLEEKGTHVEVTPE